MKKFPIEKAVSLYKSGYTMQQVAQSLGYKSHVAILKQFRKHGIPQRSRSEAQLDSYSKSKRNLPDVSGANNPAWKGGVKMEKGKYILEHCPEHPNANCQGYVRQHRLVVERHIGRYLLPDEVVHHINGDSLDNRIDNLKLYANHSQHKSDETQQAIRNSKGQFTSHP